MFKYLLSLLVIFALTSEVAQAQENKIESKKVMGTYQYSQMNGVRLSNSQLAKKMQNNPEAADLMAKARTNNTIGSIFSFIGGGLIGWQIGAAVGGGEPNWAVAGVGAGIIAVAIPFNTAFNKNSQRAVELYNAGLNAGSYNQQPELKLGFTGSGLGLQLNF